MPCFETEVDRLLRHSKQSTKSMGIEHVFNMYNQIIVHFNDRSMRIAITGFFRGGSRSGHYAYGEFVGELLPGSKQLKISKFLLNMDKLKNFPQKKVYIHTLYNVNYPFSYKKHMHIFFLI